MSLVVPYLEKQTIFITGATGFLGKVFLAKLFLTCPNLREKSIYVLVRGKKELSAQERFEKDMFEDSVVLKKLVKEKPHIRNLIRVVDGDVGKSKLGLSPADYDEVIKNITCIFHMAATTSFTENLRLAFEINVMGTKRVLDLAKSCKNLISMTYVSTCYTNCMRYGTNEVREKVYPINFDPYEVVRKILAMSPEEADKATPNIIGGHPNTYTFSKMIAEHIVLEEKGKLPLAVVRPAIISGSQSFPYPGWVDSFLGASGIVSAVGLGALHFMIGSGSCVVDLIPVDYVANTILSVSWYTAENPPGERMPIYHSASSGKNPITWERFRHILVGYFHRNPAKKALSRSWAYYISNPSLFWLSHTLFTRVPATVTDVRRWTKGEPPKMVANSKTLYNVCMSLSFFTSHSWCFANNNTESVVQALNNVDSEMFYIDPATIHWETLVIYMCEGIKKFIFKEDDVNLKSKL
eukprot:TRINITY_DN9554_c0_g1_i1.p1 TRINITY_DN9554_c0_g1~~TRINITY_DN9554_c0_g1_i1.p1  ORF type:complete len:466 (+),score=37.36 TRINITY_DN9554_c0_g1_i1:56-1453(+)